jgi:transposase-like protein
MRTLVSQYPLSYEHVAELAAERGVEVDASCIWRWVQVYAPELNKRCQSHLKLFFGVNLISYCLQIRT